MIFRHPFAHPTVPANPIFAAVLINPHGGFLGLKCFAGSDRGAWEVDQRIPLMLPINGFQSREEAAFFQTRDGIGQFLARHQIHGPRQFQGGDRDITDLEIAESLVLQTEPLVIEVVLTP